MPTVINLDHWPRRPAFEHFSRLANPYFSVCAPVDVTALPARVKRVPGATLFLAYHHAVLRAVDAVDALRCRLSEGQVLQYEHVDAGTAVLRANQTIGFVTLPYETELAHFVERAIPMLAAAKTETEGLGDLSADPAMLHMTTIPWVSFTSFSHARGAGGLDSVPKLALGKISEAAGRLSMPVAIDVHHALADGLHVGQFYEALQLALNE